MPLLRRFFVLTLLCCLAWASQARADAGESLSAYAKGDYQEAAKLAQPLAGQGDRDASRLMGEMHESGRGVPQNDALAWAYFQKAAMLGDSEAQFRLGQIFEAGRGVPQSFSDAAKWYQRAAQNGHTGAKARLGKLILAGKGGKVSFTKGLGLIEEAAMLGEPEAESLLADLERKGLARPRLSPEAQPLDAESQEILLQAERMIKAPGAPPPLGSGLSLGSRPTVVRQGAANWIAILPKPQAVNAENNVWQAAGMRLAIAKIDADLLDVRVQMPASWRYLSQAGRELGRLEIASHSISGQWSAGQGRWLRHNARFTSLAFSTAEGQAQLESALSRLDARPAAVSGLTDFSHDFVLQKGAFRSKQGEGFAFQEILLANEMKGVPQAAGADEASPLPAFKAFSSSAAAKGLKLSGRPGLSPDVDIADAKARLAGDGLDQPQSTLSLGYEASGIAAQAGAKSQGQLLPADALPERVKLSLAIDKIALRDIANQMAALLIKGSGRNPKVPHGLGDTAFDAAATLFDAMVDSGAEIRIEEMSAKGAFWGLDALGGFMLERGKALPFSGKLTLTGQGLDPLIKRLDESASFAALLLDGLKRTAPPRKDAMGNDVFELVLHSDGAIDINGQRWSGPETQAKPSAKPQGQQAGQPKKKK